MYRFVDLIVKLLKRIIPESIVVPLRPLYHLLLSYFFALWYRFPAKHMVVIGITGTKGKSTVADMLYAVLIAAGHKTALASTIRFVTPESEERNMFKMTLQGRGFIQHFLARARREGVTHAVVEITSESTVQYRHKFLFLDGLIVTNIHPEHIESHGSFEKYVAAKRTIATELENSDKKTILVANADISETRAFLDAHVSEAISFSLDELADAPTVPLPGDFNRLNALAALKMATALGVDEHVARDALSHLPVVRGRVEEIHEGQNFTVVVDYAHTPDSLKAVYGAYAGRKICVLGNTGGGRDKWKRPQMGAIADEKCGSVILTNEDPYDEDSAAILKEMATGMKRTPITVLDRRTAIRTALNQAKAGDVVLITGKGTDPYIMGPNSTKTPWDDATVVREELRAIVRKS